MKVEFVTSLKRRATEILGNLAENQEPVLISQHGRPAASLLDMSAFEAMHARIALPEGISRSEGAVDEGRVVSDEEAKIFVRRVFDLVEQLTDQPESGSDPPERRKL